MIPAPHIPHYDTFVKANMPVMEMAFLMGSWTNDGYPPYQDPGENACWMDRARRDPRVPMPLSYASWLVWVNRAATIVAAAKGEQHREFETMIRAAMHVVYSDPTQARG